jgi:hypothetical protein
MVRTATESIIIEECVHYIPVVLFTMPRHGDSHLKKTGLTLDSQDGPISTEIFLGGPSSFFGSRDKHLNVSLLVKRRRMNQEKSTWRKEEYSKISGSVGYSRT